MKIVRYGPAGEERPGAIDSAGKLRSLYPLLRDFTGDMLAPECLTMLAAIDVEKLPLVPGNPRLGVPVAGIQQIIAVGANYADHCAEGGIEIPKQPMVFAKSAGSLCGCEDPTVIPESAKTFDWEIELALLIGTGGRDIPHENALKHVAGYSTAIDFSERSWMLQYGLQLQLGKSLDTFTPLGPWFVTADEIQDPQTLDLWLDVNGERRQRGNTAQMVFSVARIIAFVSQYQTLRPGDLIVTGTPGGVGHCAKPPHYLKIGDRVSAGVAKLGNHSHEVRARADGPF